VPDPDVRTPPEGSDAVVPSGTPTPTPSTPSTAVPSYVTKDELAQTSETLLGRIAGMLDGFRAAAPQPTAPTPVQAPQVDLREIDSMIREGREGSAERVAQYVQQEVRRGVASAIATEVTPLRTYGLSALQQMAKQSVLAGDATAKRFEREILDEVNRLPEEMKGNPLAWSNAVALVKGRHHEELLAEATEATVRRETERRPDPAATGRGAPLVDDKGAKLPSAEEFAGSEGMAALRAKGVDADQWARSAGYASWKDYALLARDVELLEEKY
jgi:hypothetical protein